MLLMSLFSPIFSTFIFPIKWFYFSLNSDMHPPFSFQRLLEIFLTVSLIIRKWCTALYTTCLIYTHIQNTRTYLEHTHIFRTHAHIQSTRTYLEHTQIFRAHAHIQSTRTYLEHTHIFRAHAHIQSTRTYLEHTHIFRAHAHIQNTRTYLEHTLV